MAKIKYARLITSKSKCSDCQSDLTLLYAIMNQIRHPQFFICWRCKRIYQAGGSEVVTE